MQTGNVPDGMPEDHGLYTIGWHCIDWCEGNLYQPDGPNAGDPFQFTPEQLRFIAWWYATKDGERFLYSYGVLRRMKGWGKGPVTGGLSMNELIGPCRLAGLRVAVSPGGVTTRVPMARRVSIPEVQLAAVSYAQTANTYSLIRGMIGGRKEIDGIPIDPGKTRIYAGERSERKLYAVSRSSKTLEGRRPTFINLDEPHHLFSTNGGHDLYAVCRRNLAKDREAQSRMLSTTNAHAPGMDSVAEKDFEALQLEKDDKLRRVSMLYDCLEPSGDVDLHDEPALREALIEARGNSTWLDVDRMLDEIYSPSVSPSDSRRFYLNQVVSADDSWIVKQSLIDDMFVKDKLSDKDVVTIGFDGSLSDDATAIVVVRVSDGLAFAPSVWERPDGPGGEGWEIDTDLVNGRIEWIFDTYRVAAMFGDVHPFESYINAWGSKYGKNLFLRASVRYAVGFDMRSRLSDFTKAAEHARAMILAGEAKFSTSGYGTRVRRHIKNTRERMNRYGVGVGKDARRSKHKIDGAVAWILGIEARRVCLEKGIIGSRFMAPRRSAGGF